jgi:hypothetical protein
LGNGTSNSGPRDRDLLRLESMALDADLVFVVDHWPKLPPHVRSAILRLVDGGE